MADALRTNIGATSAATVKAQKSTSIKRDGVQSKDERAGKSVYGLTHSINSTGSPVPAPLPAPAQLAAEDESDTDDQDAILSDFNM